MDKKHLHIISFDVPYPADYGGAIDVFYRIKALHELGVDITLHCFEYGRGQQPELDKYCKEVIYYTRKKKISDQLSRLPFIVRSRKCDRLIQNLVKDDSPILFEGLHTTYYLADHRIKDRIKLVRTHNIEHEYYDQLSKNTNGLQKQYFRTEAKKLKRYEHTIQEANHILCIKESDKNYFEKYGSSVSLLPACSNETTYDYQETKPYCLFHGNLSVSENDSAAKWLIECIGDLALKVAGKSPGKELTELAKKKGVELITDPSDKSLQELIESARVHTFYTDQATGVKLKLLNALRSSGSVIVNTKMVEGTDLASLCKVAKTSDEFRKATVEKLEQKLSSEEFEQRKKFLAKHYSTKANCKKILDLI